MHIYSKQELFNYASCQTSSEMRKKAGVQRVHIDKVNPKIQGNTKGCEVCGEAFYLHEDLVKHNVQVHGATLGEQLRQSEEIRKQRESG